MKYMMYKGQRYAVQSITRDNVVIRAIVKELDGSRPQVTLAINELSYRQQARLKALPPGRRITTPIV